MCSGQVRRSHMKDQYFGDVNDFRKYGLLRALTGERQMRLGVCWMLTDNDGRTDGRFLSYLSQPQEYRHRDPELFDWLRQVIGIEGDRRTARIEGSGLLGNATFQRSVLTDSPLNRNEYFQACRDLFCGCDLVFFDPDNGLEVKSCRPGRRDSCKYLFWPEVQQTFDTGASVLIYQHFPRQERNAYTACMAGALRQKTGAAAIFSFRTPHVLFLLTAQERHVALFQDRMGAVNAKWSPTQIRAEVHTRVTGPAQADFFCGSHLT